MNESAKKPDALLQTWNAVEHVRRRPGMYIGSTQQRGLHHLFYVAFDHSIEKAVNGTCSEIDVALRDSGELAIRDNSPGIRIDNDPRSGVPLLELILTQFGNEPDMEAQLLPTSIINSLGLTAINALSKQFEIEVRRDGYVWQRRYSEGIAQTTLNRVRHLHDDESTGNTITFVPDFNILERCEYDYETLAKRCCETAYLVPGLRVTLRDERNNQKRMDVFQAFDGIISWVRDLNQHNNPLHPIVYGCEDVLVPYGDGAEFTVRIEFAFQFTDSAETVEFSFCNTVTTPDHGLHLEGLHIGILEVVNQDTPQLVNWNDIAQGFTGIVSLYHIQPSYERRNRIKINNPEVLEITKPAVMRAVSAQFPDSRAFTDLILAR